MMTTKYKLKHLTPEELYALEREAQRLRAETLAELARSGVAALKGLFAVRPATKDVRHA